MHPGDKDVYGTDLVPYEVDEQSLTPVERWRFKCFVDAGFDPISAQRLACSRADVHRVLRSLREGCSLELALEIFV